MKWRAGLLVLCCLASLPARAEPGSVATAVKATYLVKFAHYVSWPDSAFATPGAPLALCIVGHDPFGAALDAAARGERVDQHPIIVRRLATIDRTAGCHIAFISGASTAQVMPSIEGAPILSVTDAMETQARGVLYLELRGGHVGFSVDDQTAARNGLSISSRLLSIAWAVKSRGRAS